MDKKEEIILATLALASEKGLGSVSMSQIAQRLGIKKASLYNHFGSKEEIIDSMYQYLRIKSKEKLNLTEVDYGEMISGKTAEEVLIEATENYISLCCEEKMAMFYKVIYAQRAMNPTAAKIMKEETKRMLSATKNLFYALQSHRKICTDNIDTAAVSFAMTIHAMMEYRFDCLCCGEPDEKEMINTYIKWFCEVLKGDSNEKNVD
ncbi:MAG: TetR/AcrR family transcriptional regulator [Acutalibacteraceae bacterium]